MAKSLYYCKAKKRCGEDSSCGCGCLQPKLKKEGLATLIAEWNEKEDEVKTGGEQIQKTNQNEIKLPEMVIKILSKISDDDVNFMGFSSIFQDQNGWYVK